MKPQTTDTCRWSDLGIHFQEDMYGNSYVMGDEIPDLPHVMICLNEIVHEMYHAEKPSIERICCALDDVLYQMGYSLPDKPCRIMAKPQVAPDSPFFNMAIELTKSINQ